MQQELLYKVDRTLVELQDLPINLDELTKLESDTPFRFAYAPSRPYEWDPNTVAAMGIELS